MRFKDAPKETAEQLRGTFGDGRIVGQSTIEGSTARVPIQATFPAKTAEMVLEVGEWKIHDFSS
jgi:hypothetical protein